MSEESTDLEKTFRRCISAVSRRAFDEFSAMFTPDAVWDSGPFEGAFDGPDAIRRHLEAWVAPYEDYEGALEEFRDLGNGVTAVVGLARAPTKGSRQFIEYRYAVVITWADCLIQRGKVYNDPHRARAAAERLAEERR